ncbi:hypothetical protein [Nocardioides sp. Kera G14]|uniref:hypothetical protein n=1 Tax=Nocardioides sp. Kera G14 TaxID=2884264 RepID=UPI001D12D4D5|nr:hypothetical protein [Nocardioides sp. Kera G14]UDY23615.1 hypothetical protein LH076_16380 [Nocardioides sp. Kera G14]
MKDRLAVLARSARNGTLARTAKHRVKVAIARRGYLVTRMDEAEAGRYLVSSHNDRVPLPAGAEEALRLDHPRLVELQAAYDALAATVPAAVPTQWHSGFLKKSLSLAWFRGDNAYLWQLRHLGASAEIRTYVGLLDVESRDQLGLLKTLEEDGLFGAWTFEYGDRKPVGRDLLDSVNEINYLAAQTGIIDKPNLKVLDIGAGYGRLAHRMSAALPNLEVYDCTDGVATSTFLCEYYRDFRKMPESVRVVPLHEHEKLGDSYDIAVNIHSFSECSLEAIRWWLDRIAERDIEWLLIVPNTPDELRSTELDGSMEPFREDVLARGYELVDSRPVHQSDELRELMDLHDRFYLFRRTAR